MLSGIVFQEWVEVNSDFSADLGSRGRLSASGSDASSGGFLLHAVYRPSLLSSRLRRDHVRVSVHPYCFWFIRRIFTKLGCDWRSPRLSGFQFPIVNNANMAAVRTSSEYQNQRLLMQRIKFFYCNRASKMCNFRWGIFFCRMENYLEVARNLKLAFRMTVDSFLSISLNMHHTEKCFKQNKIYILCYIFPMSPSDTYYTFGDVLDRYKWKLNLLNDYNNYRPIF
jgi:hypothetical protein